VGRADRLRCDARQPDRSGAAQTLIRTFARKGVRFVGKVREEAKPAALAPEMAMEPRRPELALPNKPSIAVLPFANLSGDPEQEYFADGMVEEIITALSRIRWLFVIARNSSFTYKGQAVDVRRVGRELGVRYVLEGSVRKGSEKVRITAQLIEVATGAHLWADRFDGSLEDVFDLQDQVAISVAGVIEPTLRQAEIQRAGRKPTGNLDAYDLYLRALAVSDWEEAGLRQAVILLKASLAIDPSYAAAARIAYCRIWLRARGFHVSDEEMAEAGQLAAQAIRLGNDARGSGRAAGQEHRPASAGLPGLRGPHPDADTRVPSAARRVWVSRYQVLIGTT
jgi:TolB-like protein